MPAEKLRSLSAVAAALISFPPVAGAAEPPIATIFAAHDPHALVQFQEDATRTRRMTEQLVLAVTRQPDSVRAWRTLVSPADRVAIKVSAQGGRYFSSRRGVVEAIVAGVANAGVPRDRIFLWDRHTADLRAAGFTPERFGVAVRAIDPPRGFDREAKFTAPVLGKLIWGDLLFEERKPKAGRRADEAEQLSSASHLPTLLRGATKIVNVAMLSDEAGCGVAGAFYNVTVSAVDNWRRFTQPGGAGAIPELYADARLGPKVVLHVLDGLLAQYAGGPGFNPNYAFPHATLYASRDPVALDATALRLIDEWRKRAKLPPTAKRTEWLQSAAQMGLGQCEADRIEVRRVTPP